MRKRNNQHGSAIIELTFTLPILLLLSLFASDLARVFFRAMTINSAARAGAQYALMRGYMDIANIIQAARDDAQLPTLTVTPKARCVARDDSPLAGTTYKSEDYGTPTDWASACGALGNPSVYVDVTSQYTFTPMVDYAKLYSALSYMLGGSAAPPGPMILTGRAQIRAQ